MLKRLAFPLFLALGIAGGLQSPWSTAQPPRTVSEAERLKDRLVQVNNDIATHGLHKLPGSPVTLLTGYKYGEFFDWDLYFENIYLSYYGVSDYTTTNLKVFLDRQQPDGFVSRTLGIVYPKPHQMFKPFLAQLAVLASKQKGDDYTWLKGEYYARLQKYLTRWFEYDSDGNGLPVWNSSDASGMDNQISRSGKEDTYQDEGVDLACELVQELRAMAFIAQHLGRISDAKAYSTHADQLAAKINRVFWDEKDGFYYDRNEKTGQRIAVKSAAGFLPLWAGVASPAQAKRLVYDHLLNPKEFWVAYPISSYARSEAEFYEGSRVGECNWEGPTWIPLNYMIFHGLLDYGYRDIARQLAEKTFDMGLNQNPVTREYYDSDTGHGNGMNPFWGWSTLAYAMKLELKEDYNPMRLSEPIRPIITKDLGVSFPAH
jgi:hypothetical protein